ncbi:uncharacterized protein LOC134253198 [Saccostrea cucullata]|uniref:uncharacterized protein LOC134253198 n=1 Tax=Saccostrea cuccullata TaxID=36930 RepID=UPI002ED53930
MDHIPRLSEIIYVGLCHKIGSPTEVRIRREVIDTYEEMMKSKNNIKEQDEMKSGSEREGFRLRTSDIDYMLWLQDHKVICDLSQISLYRIPQQTVILMECDDLPPGFTRLNLLSPSNDLVIRSSCVTKNNKIFISSTLFRRNNLQVIKTLHTFFASSIPHGPCSSNVKVQGFEIDFVLCFRSHHWPTTALPWIQRCHQQGWPSEIVISEIINGGIHVVPIGSIPENDEEWRISFSRAEQKLVYSMNHCQFLCYGLLKLFLKEVIDFQNNYPVLCSYFMKTIVFWVIQSNHSFPWKPDNLLYYFWKCFKLLIYWVRIGECPNFFIPQNNMFRVKVTGSVQNVLFNALYGLYQKGISCLVLSSTLSPYISKAILYRTLRVSTDESSFMTSTELDISLFEELPPFTYGLSFEFFADFMNRIEAFKRKRLTPYEVVTLQCLTSNVLKDTAQLIENNTFLNRNRIVYGKYSKVTTLLNFSCKIGNMSLTLYLAMVFYRARRYEQSLSCLQKTQERMTCPFIVYRDNVNNVMYEHYTARISLGNKFRRVVVLDTRLHHKLNYIDELELEQKINNENGLATLQIPPLVMLHMLLILNHHRLGDTVRSQQSLQDLRTLLLYDEVNVPIHIRDISWQILGICQQITGDFLGSLQSYQYSLEQYPAHKIQEATLLRMNTLPRVLM